MDLGIRGRVALVTGGARSPARPTPRRSPPRAVRSRLDLDGEGAAGAAAELEAAGGRSRGYACDIRDSAQIGDAVGRIERDLGPVDICVNNAGLIYTMGQLGHAGRGLGAQPRGEPDGDLQGDQGGLPGNARAEMGPHRLHGFDRWSHGGLRPDRVCGRASSG